MGAQYLVRFDDLCPTANWAVWNGVESAMVAFGVKPMFAVVPDRNPELMAGAPDPLFWERVRTWQGRGWAIGLHGYQHRYVTREAGLIGRNRYSEFAGLAEAEHRRKIEAGLEIFASHGVKADVWIAPAHSFDETTLSLLAELGVDCVSDGYSLLPYRSATGQLWIPQQVARFRPMPTGLWTVCMHVNGWKDRNVARLEHDLRQFAPSITSLDRVRADYGTRLTALSDRLVTKLIQLARSMKALLQPEGGAACTSHT